MKIDRLGAGVYTVEDFLSNESCEGYILKSEEIGYEIATINAISGPQINTEIRNNDRVIFDDKALALSLYKKAKSILPKTIDGW